jgi:hypothetical protein
MLVKRRKLSVSSARLDGDEAGAIAIEGGLIPELESLEWVTSPWICINF